MSSTTTDLLVRYDGGVAAVVAALDGATDADLDRRPPGGGWTAREVVHHLADSETNSYVRLRRLLAEDNPLIVGYDEAHWARTLSYDRPIAASLAVLTAVRAASAELLRARPVADLDRCGTHSESGVYTVRTWLDLYTEHPYIHAAQITRARRGED